MRTALVSDWMVGYTGAERVVEQMLEVFPSADLYATLEFLPAAQREWLRGRKARTSFLQALPWAGTKHRLYLPLMPLAVEQFDLAQYDLILSSSHAVAKGLLRGPDQMHISYVHTPIRYAWDLQHQYLRQSKLERGLKAWCAAAYCTTCGSGTWHRPRGSTSLSPTHVLSCAGFMAATAASRG